MYTIHIYTFDINSILNTHNINYHMTNAYDTSTTL